MIPRTLNHALLNEQLKPDTFTDWLKRGATPAERQAYQRATAPGTDRRTHPKTIDAVKALAV